MIESSSRFDDSNALPALGGAGLPESKPKGEAGAHATHLYAICLYEHKDEQISAMPLCHEGFVCLFYAHHFCSTKKNRTATTTI